MSSRGTTDHGKTGAQRLSTYRLVIPPQGLFAIAAIIVATWLALQIVDRAHSVLALIIGAVTAAIVFAPGINRLSRHMPKALALVGVTLGGMALVVASASTIGWDLNRQSTALADGIEAAIERLQPESTLAELAEKMDLVTRSHDLLDDFAALAVLGDSDLTAAASQLSKLVVIAVMAAFMVSEGQTLLATALRGVSSPERRNNLRHLIYSGASRASSYCRRTIGVSTGHGLVAAGVVLILGLPGSISLGAWVALAVTMPILGGPLAWSPIVAMAFATDNWPLGVAAFAVLFIVIDRYLRKKWANDKLRLGPVLKLFGIGAGLYILGIVGGFVGLVVVATLAGILAAYRDFLQAQQAQLLAYSDGEIPLSELEASASYENGDTAAAVESAANRSLLVTFSPRTMLTSAVLVLGIFSFYRLGQSMESFVIWLAVGGFIAIGVDRPVSAIVRSWKFPRIASIAFVIGLFVAFLATVAIVAGPSVTDSANQVAKEAPEAVASLEDLPIVGKLLADNDVSQKIEDELKQLPDRLSDSSLVERVAASAGDGLIGLFWLVSIVLAILLDGPRLVNAAGSLVPSRSRQRAQELGEAAYTTLSNVAAASAFVAALNGIVVMFIALFLRVPLAPVLGVWSTAWNFIPQIGGFMGGAPLVLLAIAQGPLKGIIALVIFIAYQSFENHVLEPAVGSKAADLPPLIILIGVLIGGSLFGFVGAILAGPVLGVGKVAYLKLRGNRSSGENVAEASSNSGSSGELAQKSL
ncbi:MAG: AI-2E family transporter [Acidimicrobiia bacterium]